MLSLFRTNQVVFTIFYFGYALLLRIPLFFVDAKTDLWPGGVLGVGATQLLGELSHTSSILWSSLWVGILGILANNFVLQHRLASTNNLFPGLFTVLLASLLPWFSWANPYQLANIGLMLALLALAKTYRNKNVSDHIFNVGWWIGLASLFVPHYLLFLLMAYAGMNTLRATRFREQLVLLSGAVVPYILVGFWYFWHDRFSYFLDLQFGEGYQFLQVFRENTIGWQSYLGLAILAALLIVVLLNFGRYHFKTTMETQKKINLMYWTALLAGLSVFFIPVSDQLHLQSLVIPVGVLISFNFSLLNRGVAEVLHLLLLLAVWGMVLIYYPGIF